MKKTMMIDKTIDVLYFVNNLLCMMASFFYVFFVSITSVTIFPEVYRVGGFTDDSMLETIIKVDMFIIRRFMLMFVLSIIFMVVNYIIFKKKNKKMLLGLLILSGIVLLCNFIRVLIFYF